MAADHYTYFHNLIKDPDLEKGAVGIGVGLTLLVLGAILTKRLQCPAQMEAAVVPSDRITPFGIGDMLVEAFISLSDSVLGEKNRRYVPFCASIFIFLLVSNLIGLVPGMPAITTTVWLDVGMALAAFVYFNLHGIREHGLIGYLSHFAGPVWWLAWFIFPLEIFSTLLRILTLNLRLYWNITADHLVLGILTELLGFGAVPAYILGTFVSFMQAFVFTVLTMVYILLATQHEEGEDSHQKSHD